MKEISPVAAANRRKGLRRFPLSFDSRPILGLSLPLLLLLMMMMMIQLLDPALKENNIGHEGKSTKEEEAFLSVFARFVG